MFSKSLSALALLAALAATNAQAEGRFPAGGLSLDPQANVTIAAEDVYLSVRQVRVHYSYQSDTAQTVTLRFENPVVPIDESPDHLGGAMLPEGADKADYTQLTITAGGKAVTPVTHEYAYFNGTDITAELAGFGLAPYIDGVVELQDVFGKLDPLAQGDLVELGYVVLDSYGAAQNVGWSYRSVLEWEQALAAGTTEVEIAYVPLNGYPDGVDPAYYGEGEDKQFTAQIADFYCLDDALNRAVKKKMDAVPYFEIVELGFAVSPEDRARPIGAFTLTVDKQDTAEDMGPMTYVAFCPVDAKKISDTQFQWTAKDYLPVRDIDVVYYSFEDRFGG